MGLGPDAWWDEPAYKTCNTFHLRGLFIFDSSSGTDVADPSRPPVAVPRAHPACLPAYVALPDCLHLARTAHRLRPGGSADVMGTLRPPRHARLRPHVAAE